MNRFQKILGWVLFLVLVVLAVLQAANVVDVFGYLFPGF